MKVIVKLVKITKGTKRGELWVEIFLVFKSYPNIYSIKI